MFSKILIANRGEIACRIIKTARKMGIRTVAVYSEADAASRHVTMADEAVEIGPAPANQSYLVIDNIISAARETAAEAIHPGYGFLSENAEFAQACKNENIIFIGPPVDAIQSMGSKSRAKEIMSAANVPLVPGYHGAEQDKSFLKKQSDKIGYPVLIKASAGGGGKGMRVIDCPADFSAGLEAAKREAKSAFSDDHVLIEKYLCKPRHIEIQIFCDNTGDAVFLFERDCSVQRRHQKVLEEAPAPGMDQKQRDEMGAAAIKAAQAINYVGAGTIEFIVDEDGSYYFMEMNTRLQVEHPVTELITGQDLVEWQIRIANNEPLPCKQSDLSINGHALEARIYAEDPDNEFLPSTGHLSHLRFPQNNRHVRVDTGVREGDSVTVHYDPMIAKLIVWDHDRKSCLRRMLTALNETQIVGVTTNLDFLSSVVSHDTFQSAQLDTHFINLHHDQLLLDSSKVDENIIGLAALYILLKRKQLASLKADSSTDPFSPWHLHNSWQMNLDSYEQLYFTSGKNEHCVTIYFENNNLRIEAEEKKISASGSLNDTGDLTAILDAKRIHVTVVQNGSELTILHSGNTYNLHINDKKSQDIDEDSIPGSLSSPMPGKVLDVMVREGDKVSKGMPLLVLEAMKMEHTILAPLDGKVSIVHFCSGDMIDEGVELLVIEE